MSIETATQKNREASERLREIAVERKRLPGQIAAAAEAGDKDTLATLSHRKVAIEAEYVAANTADKRAQIELFEAELEDLQAKASALTNALPAEKQRLDDERAELEAKLQQNKQNWELNYHNEIRARQAVDDQKVKITAAREALNWYVKESGKAAAA
jgi:hypothetical protein